MKFYTKLWMLEDEYRCGLLEIVHDPEVADRFGYPVTDQCDALTRARFEARRDGRQALAEVALHQRDKAALRRLRRGEGEG